MNCLKKILFVILVFVFSVGCRQQPEDKKEKFKVEQIDKTRVPAVDIALDFINNYVENCNK